MFQDDEVAQPDPEQANTARIAALGDDEFWAELFNAVCVRYLPNDNVVHWEREKGKEIVQSLSDFDPDKHWDLEKAARYNAAALPKLSADHGRPDLAVGYEARLLAQDERLRKLRFRLVPRRVKEKTFWRQFFQQVAAGLVAHFPPVARVGAPAAAAAAAAAGPSKKLLEPWRKLSSQVVLERKPWLVVEEHKVGLPGGKEIPGWTFIRSRDFVNVAVAARRPEVAEVKGAGDLQWVLLRQHKYGVCEALGVAEVVSPVGGYIEKGEDPQESAKREVLEELGYQSDRWVSFGASVADANRGNGVGHLFLALNASFVGKKGSHDDLEEQEAVFFSTEQLENLVLSGGVKVNSWCACLSMALQYVRLLERNKQL